MIHVRYKDQINRAFAMIRHLARAVRASRAFFIVRDRDDPAAPHIVACHPPLADDTLLALLKQENIFCTPVLQEGSRQAWIGVTTGGDAQLAQEMTEVVAQSIATELRSIALDGARGSARDSATGLFDKDAFLAHVEDGLRCETDSTRLALLLIDLDRYHRVQARFGEMGAEVLVREVAARLQRATEADDAILGRVGGDRFAVLYRADADSLAAAGAERIHQELEDPIRVGEEEIFVTASIGVAFSAAHNSAGDLMRDADLAIEQLTAQGGDTTLVFRAGMHNSAAFQLLRERDVRLAVARHEFILHFQPIVAAARSGGLHAFEALLRWRNPEEGLLPPSTFMDVLNETGLIDVVGRRVIREAVAHAARWMALSGTLVPVSVNIVPVQLYAPDFTSEIARVLLEEGLPAEGLILELTENALIDDASRAHRVLQGIRDLGVQVFIDDFGTGYSSLSYLHDLPVTGIKLDRTFLRSIDSSSKQREIVRTIVHLAHYMDMAVVAEGVEQPYELTAVQDLNCDFAQGFCLARPFDAEQATRYLAQHLAQHNAA